MKFSVIICTYMRPGPLQKLLQSINSQTISPFEILVVDGSKDGQTQSMLSEIALPSVKYFMVSEQDRGLTRQRNYGISKTSDQSSVICFLDDDTILEPEYFQELMHAYSLYPDALGVGGYIFNETHWEPAESPQKIKSDEFYFDSWKRKDGSRFVLRKKLGLEPDTPPGYLPEFSHGRSIGFLPPSGKIYQVGQLMGGVSSFKKDVFDEFKFSTYFEGYGLYEDADFTFRVNRAGPLYVNTKARLAHYHDESGRPNKYKYGKMVVRNGWYVWRVKYPSPSAKAIFKWHAITWLLALLRLGNVVNTNKRMEAFTEFMGRFVGWISILISPPKTQP